MKNFIQPGNTLTVAAPYAVNSGQGVLVGQLFGVAAETVDINAQVDIATVGVFDLAKKPSAIFQVGGAVFFDVDTKTCRSAGDDDSNSAGENEAVIGVAVAAVGAGASTVRVKLGPVVTLV